MSLDSVGAKEMDVCWYGGYEVSDSVYNIWLQLLIGGGSICVWNGICFEDRIDLVLLVNTTMTAEWYTDMDIEPIIVPFVGAFGENFF